MGSGGWVGGLAERGARPRKSSACTSAFGPDAEAVARGKRRPCNAGTAAGFTGVWEYSHWPHHALLHGRERSIGWFQQMPDLC